MANKRWLLRGVFLLPLLLAAAGWLWSGTHRSHVGYVHEERVVWCGSGSGVLGVELGWDHAMDPALPNGWYGGTRPIDPARYWPEARPNSWLGFGFAHFSVRDPDLDQYVVVVPYWFVLLASAGVFMWVWRRTRPRPELAQGFEVQLAARENGHG